jgi:two-component system chemotaxis sensor kinase CheA
MAKDPYKYFRVEARELLDGLAEGILQLEKGPCAPEVVARLLRLAHTLKGAARVVKQPGIAELAHAVEGILTTQREEEVQALSREQGSELLGLLDEIASRLSALEPASGVAVASPARPLAPACPLPGEPLETLRVEIREMDSLLRTVTEVGVQFGAVRKRLGAAGRLCDLTSLLVDLLAARHAENGTGASAGMVHARSLAEELRSSLDRFQRRLAVDLERVDRELAGIRDVAHRLRLIPAQTVFPSLERSARDAAQTLGKRIAFEASGGEVRLDANVLASLRDALMHVVRNAVAHGVETESERRALGKSPTGQVRLEVEQRGGRVAFVCRDDGRQKGRGGARTRARIRGAVPAGRQGHRAAWRRRTHDGQRRHRIVGKGNRPGCRAGDPVPAERRNEHSKRAGARCDG